MNVFLSYSTEDLALVQWIAQEVRHHANVYYWDESRILGERAWDSIFGWIDLSDFVIVVITDNTVRRGMAVGQEVGRAVTMKKTVIPLVAEGVPDSALGCLSGITYSRLTHNNLTAVMEQINRTLAQRQQQVNTTLTLFIIGGIVALLWPKD